VAELSVATSAIRLSHFVGEVTWKGTYLSDGSNAAFA